MKEDELETHLEALITGDRGQAIVNQEKRGQEDVKLNDILPKQGTGGEHPRLEKLGFRFGESVDELFIEASLPEGWTKVPTDHPLHTHVNDDQGRKRAHIVYKAAFYDRHASFNLVGRFTYNVQPVGGYTDETRAQDYRTQSREAVVTDNGQVIWTSEPLAATEQRPSYDLNSILGLAAQEWLVDNRPDWKDVTAYWEED